MAKKWKSLRPNTDAGMTTNAAAISKRSKSVATSHMTELLLSSEYVMVKKIVKSFQIIMMLRLIYVPRFRNIFKLTGSAFDSFHRIIFI